MFLGFTLHPLFLLGFRPFRCHAVATSQCFLFAKAGKAGRDHDKICRNLSKFQTSCAIVHTEARGSPPCPVALYFDNQFLLFPNSPKVVLWIFAILALSMTAEGVFRASRATVSLFCFFQKYKPQLYGADLDLTGRIRKQTAGRGAVPRYQQAGY